MDSLLHHNLTQAQWVSFITLLVIGLPVAAYILRTCLSLFNEEMPSYGRAMFIVPAVALGAYLAFDVLSYLVLLAIKDLKVIQRTPYGQAGFGFSQWLFTALPIKWAILSVIPFIRYTLVFIVIAIAGILQVFFLTIPFRKALFIFAAQWAANLFAYFIISNVLKCVFYRNSFIHLIVCLNNTVIGCICRNYGLICTITVVVKLKTS